MLEILFIDLIYLQESTLDISPVHLVTQFVNHWVYVAVLEHGTTLYKWQDGNLHLPWHAVTLWCSNPPLTHQPQLSC